MKQLPIFVYGTLKPGGTNYASYLAGKTSAERRATLSGAALYTEGLYPYLALDAELAAAEEQVHGMLLSIRPELYPELLAQLDWLEDYRPGSQWSLYRRVALQVSTAEGALEAWTYVAGPRTLAAIRAGRLRKIEGGSWPDS